MPEKKQNTMDEALTKRLDERLEKDPNILLEFKKAKLKLFEAIDNYLAILKKEETLDSITEELVEEKLDSWGKCLNHILYYEKIEGRVKENLSDMNSFLQLINKRKEK